jgi:hypothetical protein
MMVRSALSDPWRRLELRRVPLLRVTEGRFVRGPVVASPGMWPKALY